MPIRRKTKKKSQVKNDKPRFNPSLPKAKSTITAKSIIRKVNAWCLYHSTIGIDYARWYCGITNNPPKRKTAHKAANATDPYAWCASDAKSKRIAEFIETHFYNLGMKDSDYQRWFGC